MMMVMMQDHDKRLLQRWPQYKQRASACQRQTCAPARAIASIYFNHREHRGHRDL